MYKLFARRKALNTALQKAGRRRGKSLRRLGRASPYSSFGVVVQRVVNRKLSNVASTSIEELSEVTTQLKFEVEISKFGIERFCVRDDDIFFYTGFPNYNSLIAFWEYVKIRLILFERDLAFWFHVSVSTVSDILITWTNYLYIMLESLPVWVSKEKIFQN